MTTETTARGYGKVPRVVVVTRATEYEELLRRHGTRAQARFFLQTQGQELEPIVERHERSHEATRLVRAALPSSWRRASIERRDVARFVFEPDDVVVAVGQDGLVANVAKYLEGQPVVGVNPDRGRYDGVLVRHAPKRVDGPFLEAAWRGECGFEVRTMVEARLDDGQRLVALNEVFVGHATHQSARYRLAAGGREEYQSSSGIVVCTGTGATGWGRSIHRGRQTDVVLPAPAERRLAFFVREAFPSVATGTELTDGSLSEGQRLQVTSQMNRGGVLFGDGMEDDRITFGWGRTARIGVADAALRLVG